MGTQRPEYVFFLLSPANLDGRRAAMLFNPRADFEVARRLRSAEGASIGDVFTFVSGLYFRGKAAYAAAFARSPPGFPGALVITAGDGLTAMSEAVTPERLSDWARIQIDHRNPLFTAPLVEHASLLRKAYGACSRFVLLGSVATEKYVEPLTRVFADDLLFPSEFLGRGDMSRGAVLLEAVRAGEELEYEPVLGAVRRRSRRPPDFEGSPQATPELVVLVGLPGAGKTTFAQRRFESHVHVSLDKLRNNPRPRRRQLELIRQALREGRSVVVDNTNASRQERRDLIEEAHRHGARVLGYYFEVSSAECLARNARREGRARVPAVGVFATAKRLVPPAHAEGFDELCAVRVAPPEDFELRPLPPPVVQLNEHAARRPVR